MKHLIPFMPKPPVVSVVRLQGAIGTGGRSLSDAALASVLERAFSRGKPAAVALVINSPGGSPVQSSLIAARIRRLAEEKRVPVHGFVEDVAASGGYWLATAADQIWVDESSLVGSIGVIYASFGFPELMQKAGVERRVHTAGRSKSFADPFKPERPEDVERIHKMLAPLHQNFIAQVKARRGARLAAEADLFNADIWVGRASVENGLTDGIGHLVPKMKELFGPKVRLVGYGQRRGLLQRFGMGMTDALMASVEERALWARYGL
ncbi:S49 family peptidase [Pseudorhodobacter sp. MZDSW-24AT]|uniref:S49 family peptidase n=1 Tax=Pseudorhodobacter sp. MZDSW-24AT TaxID=2052957 RepID=UPI000C1F488F|nr:S49 family peptidase [Pseudorhodobacter sp. MZDSW-24AT]PJF08663.1 S49 family peptidase [Pseudorhodobacter sp. MZDSW-24AT]